jgi:ubiquinone/menaquinone biosynthesis C-methylase UbiE
MDPKTMWGSGNYLAVAEKIAAVGEVIVERSELEPGMEVLDVACGTGNATIPAARAGARVTGLDFSSALFSLARERAADAMVEVEWTEADAQELPFEDASFDRVISTFGHMFAPNHRRTAEEMIRVCRPGGAVAIACWTPNGAIGRMFGAVGELGPPPPPGAEAPTLWGTEQHVRELMGDAAFERREVEWRDSSVESYASFMLESFGPLVSAREALAERASELDERYRTYLEDENLATDGTLLFRGEYLISVIRP